MVLDGDGTPFSFIFFFLVVRLQGEEDIVFKAQDCSLGCDGRSLCPPFTVCLGSSVGRAQRCYTVLPGTGRMVEQTAGMAGCDRRHVVVPGSSPGQGVYSVLPDSRLGPVREDAVLSPGQGVFSLVKVLKIPDFRPGQGVFSLDRSRNVTSFEPGQGAKQFYLILSLCQCEKTQS